MKIYHVSDGTVGERRTEDRNIILKLMTDQRRSRCTASRYFICPVIYRFFIIYFFSKPPYERTRCPDISGRLLFSNHLIQNGSEPVFELAIVVVRHNEISYPVHPASSQVCAVQIKISKVCLPKALYEIFLDAARCRN